MSSSEPKLQPNDFDAKYNMRITQGAQVIVIFTLVYRDVLKS